MEEKKPAKKSFIQRKALLIHHFKSNSQLKIYTGVLVGAIILGVGSGYVLASGNKGAGNITSVISKQPQTAQQDDKTFNNFAEGKLVKKPEPKKGENQTEGTHLLIRDGAEPVTLTSSVVDLSQYENKKVKVLGQTLSAPGVAWFMDVGKVEEIK